MRRLPVRRPCTLFSVALAMLLTSGRALAQEPSAAPPHEAQAARKCQTVHIDADPLYGIEADDVVVCDDENPQPGLKAEEGGDWLVGMRITYDLPVGTRVTYAFDHTSSNCISSPFAASAVTETVAKSGEKHYSEKMFQASSDFLFGSCTYERSWASWNITAVAPSGASHTANIRIVTGKPNPIGYHYAEVECHFQKGMGCTGGGPQSTKIEQQFGAIVPLRLGPLEGTPPPRAPELICTGTAHVRQGEPMDGTHPCTIEGYPLPTVKVTGLPASVTLTRWPTENDTWLVLKGSVNVPYRTAVTVTASRDGWADSKTFWLNVQ